MDEKTDPGRADIFSVFSKGVCGLWFIGIGGISMSSLALTSRDRGLRVGGSDRSESAVTERLLEAGIEVHIGHSAANVDGGWDAVIYNAAIPQSNPELSAARAAGIPCFTRAEYLGYVMTAYKTRIGVAGMHGKSTTTSMLAHMFLAAGLDPTIEDGAELNEIGGAYRDGGREYFIFEACEYTDSFLSFFPTISVALNIDLDHLDYFSGMEHIVRSFTAYLAKGDTAVVNADDPNVMLAAKGFGGRLVTFAVQADAEFTARDITFERGLARFTVFRRGERLTDVRLSVPGEFNVWNALAAFACGWLCGIAPDVIAGTLASFTGCKRRFERVGFVNGAELYDDYAHHPREIAATLRAARGVTAGRVICVFQPHTYARTYELFDEFTRAFTDADEVVLTDIYAARESNTFGVSSAGLAEAIRNAVYMPGMAEAAAYVRKAARPGDIVLCMGAGDIWKLRDMLV